MLFNSHQFIFIFLPLALIGFVLLARLAPKSIAICWIIFVSFVFYGCWDWRYLPLLAASIGFNYWAGRLVASGKTPAARRVAMGAAVAFNLLLLGYFKYANFFVNETNELLGTNYNLAKIILPLAISFFTFQQISYIVDIYRGVIRPASFLEYCLCVVFFPHLIAGPIVNYREILSQLRGSWIENINSRYFALGITFFAIGLSKKVLLADQISQYATPIFAAAETPRQLTFLEAWIGALSYTVQLYFDFSGYSDMAIGLGLMFGIRLPFNFNSPYKAHNIIEFWRRWHITLSLFLRNYLYIPLGGNRRGRLRRYANLMIAMVLGGLWHGAAWTFVAWGALHGLYLMINHAWVSFREKFAWSVGPASVGRLVGTIVTFTAVVIGWVLFRAETMGGAWNVLKAMFGFHGIALPMPYLNYLDRIPNLVDILRSSGFQFADMPFFTGVEQLTYLVAMLLIIWCCPNTQQITAGMAKLGKIADSVPQPEIKGVLQFRPSPAHAVIIAALFYFSVVMISKQSEFLYFNF